MAVKPITNNQTVNKSTINRAKQRSFRNAAGNTRQGVVPGKDFSKGFAITLRDIDETVLGHMKNVMNFKVKEANEMVKVPVLYGNEERWKAIKKNGVLRDKNGTVTLPVIVVRRTDVSFDDNIPMSFDHDLKGQFIKVVRTNKWSKTNYYDRFSIQTGKNPAQERITTGMPDHVNCTYSIAITTGYMDQMNQINEIFLEHIGMTWGESDKYKFRSSIQGGIADATEMTADSERIVKSTLSIIISAYVMPWFANTIFGNTPEIGKQLTPNRVVFVSEIS
jgi:hypothetical protein